MATCWHYGMTEAGTCNECGAAVAFEPTTDVEVYIGTEGAHGRRASVTQTLPGHQPVSAAEGIAAVLGVKASDVVVADVLPQTEGWSRAVNVKFTLRGSSVTVPATVTVSHGNERTPERVEYTKAEESANA